MIARQKAESPFLLLLLPFMAGIACRLWVNANLSLVFVYSALAFAALAFIVLNAGYAKLKIYRRQWLGGMLMMVALYLAGYIAANNADERRQQQFFAGQHASQLLVQVNSEPKQSGNYIRFAAAARQSVLNQRSTAATGNFIVMVPATTYSNTLTYGDLLLIPAAYTPVAPPYNPAEFDYKQYLANQNIYYQIFLTPGKYTVYQRDAGNVWIAYALRLRKQLVARLQAGLKNAQTSAVASTLMLGYKADLSTDVVQAYATTGTLHVLSVSGAHVAIIYALINICLSFLNRYKYGRWLKALLSIMLIWAYALLTGFSPAVCRASMMLTFFITGRTLYRHTSAINLLAASAFVLLLYQPLLLADVGFQLSYAAVFGLFVVQPVIQQQVKVENKWLKKLWYLCSASTAAQLATLPLSVFYFHQFPVYFLISNLLIIVPTELIIVSGGLYLLLYPITPVASLLAWILNHTILIMNSCLGYIEHLPYASLNGFWFTGTEVLVLSVLIIAAVWFIFQRKNLSLFTTLLCAFMLALFAGFKTYHTANSNTIVFFNINKHSAILFRAGNKATLLTDISQRDKAFNYTLKPCLDSSRLQEYHIINLHQKYSNPAFAKAGNYIQFLDKSVLIVDSGSSFRPLKHPLTVDYVYIAGKNKADLNLLSKDYVYHTIIAGAANSNQSLQLMAEFAKRRNKKFISLKRNKSFIIASN